MTHPAFDMEVFGFDGSPVEAARALRAVPEFGLGAAQALEIVRGPLPTILRAGVIHQRASQITEAMSAAGVRVAFV